MEFINETIQFLHEAIMIGNYEDVKEVIMSQHFDKHAYNAQNESAGFTAIKWERTDIYELLVSKGFSLGFHEDIDNILSQFRSDASKSQVEKRKLREIHKKYFKNSTAEHLMILQQKSKLSHESSESDRSKYQPEIVKAFEELNEVLWIAPILKIAAHCTDLNIVFDFERASVDHLDPTKDKTVRGTTYPVFAFIYIGAKGLLDDKQRLEVLGTIAHELCHFVLTFMYRNNSKPYCFNDVARACEFDEVLNACKAWRTAESIIFQVFLYAENNQPAELIARVPHLLVCNKNNPERMKSCWMTFEKLFNFFEEKVLKDMNRQLLALNAIKEVKELNSLIGFSAQLEKSKLSLKPFNINLKVNKNIFVIETNCNELTMKAIQRQLDQSRSIFMKFEAFKDDKTFYLIVKAFHLCVEPLFVVDCGDIKADEVISKFSQCAMKQRMILITKASNSNNEPTGTNIFKTKLHHIWSDLTDEAQNILLESTVNFQGKEIILRNIFNQKSNQLQTIPLDKLITREKINIGELNFREIKNYIERKFLPSSLEVEYENLEHESSDLLNFVEQNQLILLSDKPGNGKTTEMKMMSLKLKEKFPFYWVVFLDLKKYTCSYIKDGEMSCKLSDSLRSCEDIARVISQKILNLEDLCEKVFTDLFKNDRVILLFDGFDEISPNYKQFVMFLMRKIVEISKNRLLISTRTHLEKELREELNTAVYKLKELTKEDQRKFFKDFSNLKFERQNSSENLQQIEKFIDALENLSNDLAFNPLLMRMIAEIQSDGENISTLNRNFYSIYDEFVKKMVRTCMDKGAVVQKDLADLMARVENFHQITALRKVFHNSQEINELIEICFDDSTLPSHEQMLRVGFMFGESFDNFQFLHQTFAEFFIANFICNNLFHQKHFEQEEVLTISSFLVKILKQPEFKMVRTFLNDAFASFEMSQSLKKFKGIKKVFEKFFENQQNFDIFVLFVEESFLNLIKIVSFLTKENETTLVQLWRHKNSFGHPLLMLPLLYQSVDFIKNLADLAEEFFDGKLLKECMFEWCPFLFTFDVEMEKTGLMLELFIVTAGKWLTQNEIHFLLSNLDEESKNFIKIASSYKSIDIGIDLLALVANHWGVSCLTFFFHSHAQNDPSSLLYYVCHRGSTELLKSVCESLREKLGRDEFRKALVKPSGSGVTAAMFAATNKHAQAFDVFLFYAKNVFNDDELKKMLLEEDNRSLKVLHWSAKNEKEQNFKSVKSLYTKLFETEELRKIMLKSNNDGENVLFFALKVGFENVKTISALWKFTQKLFDNQALKNILMTKNHNGKTIFMQAKKLQNLKPFLAFADNTFDSDEMYKLGIVGV